jgi:hypothetical protein
MRKKDPHSFKTSCKKVQVTTCLYLILEKVDSQIIINYYHLISFA